ncbi:MAG: hypothetical protein AAFU85_18140, partial [Planctomycetota bacterium]
MANDGVSGAVTPPATEVIAFGVEDSLGGAGYVVVGPCPASVSGEGLLPKLNKLHFGVTLRQPAKVKITAAQATFTRACFDLEICILAALILFCAHRPVGSVDFSN